MGIRDDIHSAPLWSDQDLTRMNESPAVLEMANVGV